MPIVSRTPWFSSLSYVSCSFPDQKPDFSNFLFFHSLSYVSAPNLGFVFWSPMSPPHPLGRPGSPRICTIPGASERRVNSIWSSLNCTTLHKSSGAQSAIVARSWTRSRIEFWQPIQEPSKFNTRNVHFHTFWSSGTDWFKMSEFRYLPKYHFLQDRFAIFPDYFSKTCSFMRPPSQSALFLRLYSNSLTHRVLEANQNEAQAPSIIKYSLTNTNNFSINLETLNEASERWLRNCGNSVCFCNVVMGNSGGWDYSKSRVKIRAAWPTGP